MTLGCLGHSIALEGDAALEWSQVERALQGEDAAPPPTSARDVAAKSKSFLASSDGPRAVAGAGSAVGIGTSITSGARLGVGFAAALRASSPVPHAASSSRPSGHHHHPQQLQQRSHMHLPAAALWPRVSWACTVWPQPPSGGVAGDDRTRCLYGNTLRDGFRYGHNEGRGTRAALCGECACCRRAERPAASLATAPTTQGQSPRNFQ